MYRLQNRHGFTLIETVMVLMLVTWLTLVTIQIPKAIPNKTTLALFVAEVKQCVYLAQHHALISGNDQQCVMDTKQGKLYSSVPNSRIITIPNEVDATSVVYKFAGITGKAKQFNNIIIKNVYESYSIRMQFGKGALVIEKNKE